MRGFRDRDFIETTEGMLFCIIGNVHPVNRVIAYLKYIPHFKSEIRTKWSKDGVMYGRILPYYSAMGVEETKAYLKNKYPDYVVFDKYRAIELIEVPKDRVKKHFKPEERLKELAKDPRDNLEEMALNLVRRLSKEAGISIDDFGITGSILLRIHNIRYSDIDIVVYGVSNGWKLRNTLKKLFNEGDPEFSLPKGETLEKWAKDIVNHHPLTIEEAILLYSRYKWNRALYKRRQFSIHPVKLENEVDEKWEDKIHKPLGLIRARATVVDASDSLFMPATYVIEDVEVLKGRKPHLDITRVVSYEGLYIDIAGPGDRIEVFGKLEEIHDLRKDEKYCQITIGTVEAKGQDYIKPLKWLSEYQGF